MEEKFVITEISNVIMVGKEEYSKRMTSFAHLLRYNELIFHFSGKSTVYFADNVFEKDVTGTIPLFSPALKSASFGMCPAACSHSFSVGSL